MTAFTTKLPRTAAAASDVTVTPAGNLASTNVQAALAELQADIDLAVVADQGKINKTGIDSDVNGNYTSTLTYNESTRTVIIAPTGSSFDVYIQGIKYSKTTQSIVHPATGTGHFIYFDETGTLVTSLAAWNLLIHAPVAFVFQDVTNSRRICFEERHHSGRDVWWHRNQHINEGTKVSTAVTILGYTLADGSTDAAVTYGISTYRLEDEDIRLDTEALPDAGPYTIMRRVGAGGDWQVTRTSTLPYVFSGANLQYNLNTAGTWSDANVTEDFYVNYWVFGVTSIPRTDYTPSPTTTQQTVIVAGQAIHSTQGAASAETFTSISWGTIPFQELAPLYQVTLRYNASNPGAYTNTTRTAIIAITRIIGTAAQITATAIVDHGSLAGLADLDHPASAIINTPAGNLVATDVQSALNELDTEKAALAGAAFTGEVSISSAGSGNTLRVTNTGTGNSFVVEDSANPDSTPFVIGPNGEFAIGTNTVDSSRFLIVGTDTSGNRSISVDRYSDSTTGSSIAIRKARGTPTVPLVVNAGDSINTYQGFAHDGTGFIEAFRLTSLVDLAPSTGIIPSRYAISLASRTGALVEAVRFDSSGQSIFGSNATNGPALSTTVSARVRSATGTYTDGVTAISGTVTHGTINSFDNPAIAATNATVTYTNASTVYIDGAPTNGTNVTITNPYSLYVASGAEIHGGNCSFGQVVAPIAAVDTTSFATNIATNTAATYTVLTSDHTLVQTTAASVYTLPAAASFPGRILHLLTQFAGTVTSASSNVVPIAGGAAGTAILAATAGKFATLQSNGTNWLIIASN